MCAQKRELVPVAALTHDLPTDHVEEPAASEAQRVPPLEDGPLAVLKHVLHDADHPRGGEAGGEHLTNRFSPAHRGFSYLMVNRVLRIESSECIGVGAIERIDPSPDQLTGLHALAPTICQFRLHEQKQRNQGLYSGRARFAIDLPAAETHM